MHLQLHRALAVAQVADTSPLKRVVAGSSPVVPRKKGMKLNWQSTYVPRLLSLGKDPTDNSIVFLPVAQVTVTSFEMDTVTVTDFLSGRARSSPSVAGLLLL